MSVRRVIHICGVPGLAMGDEMFIERRESHVSDRDIQALHQALADAESAVARKIASQWDSLQPENGRRQKKAKATPPNEQGRSLARVSGAGKRRFKV